MNKMAELSELNVFSNFNTEYCYCGQKSPNNQTTEQPNKQMSVSRSSIFRKELLRRPPLDDMPSQFNPVHIHPLNNPKINQLYHP